MKTSLKTGVAQVLSCYPPKMGGSKIWGGGTAAPKLKRISSSSSNYVVLTF